jgi:peptide/nickel transport system substrate-binding protein
LTYSLFVIPNSQSNYYGPLWGLWYSSGGKAEGSIKPTGDALKIVADFDKIIVSNNQKEIDKLTDEILTLWAKNLWAVPVLGFFNFPVVVRNNFRNVPKEGTLAYPYCSPGYMNPEQFFFKK